MGSFDGCHREEGVEVRGGGRERKDVSITESAFTPPTVVHYSSGHLFFFFFHSLLSISLEMSVIFSTRVLVVTFTGGATESVLP